MSLLIKDTTREERAKIVAQSLGNGCGSCDGCGAARYVSDAGPERIPDRSCPEGY